MKRLLFMGIGLWVGAASLQAQPGPVRATDLYNIQVPGSPTWSPDGSRLAYTVRKTSEDGAQTQLWMYADGSHRQLTAGASPASSPAWHPDGRSVYFLRSQDRRSTLFRLPLDGGEALPAFTFGASVGGYELSPDGSHILFSSGTGYAQLAADSSWRQGPVWDPERPGRRPADVPAGTKPDPDGDLNAVRAFLAANESKNDPRVIHRLNLQGELDLAPHPGFTHLYVVENRPDAKPVQLTSGYFSVGGAAWSPDGREIWFSAAFDSTQHPDRVNHSRIWRMNRDGSGLRLAIAMADHAVFNPTPSPDGRHWLFTGRDQLDQGYAQTRLFLYETATGRITHLTESFDRSVGGFEWAPDNRTVWFTAQANGGTPLYRLDTRTRRIERTTSTDEGVGGFDLGPSGFAYVHSTAANPYELVRTRPDGTRREPITTLNSGWIAERTVSIPEKGTLTRDGFEIEYWIMKPAGYVEGRTYPLLVNMHGGPAAMWGPGMPGMWHEFNYFTSRGYGVVYANPRGSGGYGRDFQAGNYRDWGFGPAADVLAAADIAAALPWVDKNRQVLTGGSYAGYLTAWIVAHDHRFKAAVAQRGVYDLATFLGEGNAWRLVPNHFGGYPWEADVDSVLEANSPITYVDRIRTPLLIKHGDQDLRTGVIQSEMLYKALKIRGMPVEYVRYPREGHELSRSGEPAHIVDRLVRYYEFFERYIR